MPNQEYKPTDNFQSALSFIVAILSKDDTLADEIETMLSEGDLGQGLSMVVISLMSRVIEDNPGLTLDELVNQLRVKAG